MGNPISISPVPEEIIWFLLAKEFHWLPSEIQNEKTKDVKAITHIMSVYNRVRNQEIERQQKRKNNKVFGKGKQYIDITDPEVEKRVKQGQMR